jgi:hypothetical protein
MGGLELAAGSEFGDGPLEFGGASSKASTSTAVTLPSVRFLFVPFCQPSIQPRAYQARPR